MNGDVFHQEQAEFSRSEVSRLLDPEQSFPPFEGLWAQALVALLRKKYQANMRACDPLLNQVLSQYCCFKEYFRMETTATS